MVLAKAKTKIIAKGTNLLNNLFINRQSTLSVGARNLSLDGSGVPTAHFHQ